MSSNERPRPGLTPIGVDPNDPEVQAGILRRQELDKIQAERLVSARSARNEAIMMLTGGMRSPGARAFRMTEMVQSSTGSREQIILNPQTRGDEAPLLRGVR